MTGRPSDPAREARLKAALKANISRRKAQARARTRDAAEEGAADADDGAEAPGNTGPREDE